MHFEINAAFDHLSTRWNLPEDDEKKVVTAVCGHLKRSCYDAYKLILKQTREQYERLCDDSSISLIDSGRFEANLHRLWSEIEKGANKARFAESMSRTTEQWGLAFDLWDYVFDKCVTLRDDLFSNGAIKWANQKAGRMKWKERMWTAGISFLVGLLAAWIASSIF